MEKLLKSLVWRKGYKEGSFLRYIKFETTMSERAILLQKGMVFRKGDMYYLTKKGAQRLFSYQKRKNKRKENARTKETILGPTEQGDGGKT
ncbi:MAG: hypothetical protein JXC33_07970 [Deltaproteobacteria bacterium]|nr:hypothetical protein [Deltaproteobacteria bacterium]